MNEMKIYWPNSKLYLKYDEVASELVARASTSMSECCAHYIYGLEPRCQNKAEAMKVNVAFIFYSFIRKRKRKATFRETSLWTTPCVCCSRLAVETFVR